jgi:hypothetical protein
MEHIPSAIEPVVRGRVDQSLVAVVRLSTANFSSYNSFPMANPARRVSESHSAEISPETHSRFSRSFTLLHDLPS